MSAHSNHFKLGLFILGSLALFVAALIFFGLGTLHKDKVKLESYFDESVQGLDVGSALKFKGVKVGSVESIRFVFNKYHDVKASPFRYVLVEMALNPGSAFSLGDEGNFREAVAHEVERGLRVRIAPQGLTGTGYLEMDYLDPRRNKPLPIQWTPDEAYVPSAPSTIARLEETFESFSKTLRKVEEAGVDQAVENMNALLVVTRKAVEDANMEEISTNLDALLSDLRRTSAHLDAAIGSKEAKQALKNLAKTLANMKAGTDNLPAAVEQLRKLLREANMMLSSQRDQVQNLIEQGKQTFENLNELTGEAKRNPSSLMFGPPPAKSHPEKSR